MLITADRDIVVHKYMPRPFLKYKRSTYMLQKVRYRNSIIL